MVVSGARTEPVDRTEHANPQAAVGAPSVTQTADLDDAQLVAAATPAACSPNDTKETLAVSGEKRCIAGYTMSTRRRLKQNCLTGPGSIKLQYTAHECNNGRGRQIEAIAQARAIAKFNRGSVMGHTSATGITPDIQWEVVFRSANSVLNRIDVLLYDHTATGPINVVEVKVAGAGESVQQAAGQANGYVNGFPGGEVAVDGPAVESSFASGQNRTLTFSATVAQRIRISVTSICWNRRRRAGIRSSSTRRPLGLGRFRSRWSR